MSSAHKYSEGEFGLSPSSYLALDLNVKSKCNILSGKSIGVWVRAGGKGTLIECEIARNKGVGLQVDGGAPVLSACLLQKLPVAARYTAAGGGELSNCILTDNVEGIVVVDGDGPRITPEEEAVEE